LISFLATKLVRTITWVKVEKPVFDLVGVVLGSLSLAGILAVAAALLGSIFGFILIRRARRITVPASDAVSLHLDAASTQA
jgi:positive regulator of sigma E activity